jgi:predicted MarR family transcription regulator
MSDFYKDLLMERARSKARLVDPSLEAATAIAPDSASRHEQVVTAFEYAVWHLGSAFARWRRDCLARLPGGGELSGAEASILHIIHVNDTAKGLAEISRLLHRDDLSNIQYGLKKLLALGYIEKADPRAPRKSVCYRVSTHGRALIEAYLRLRRDVLLRLTARLAGTTAEIESATLLLHLMIGVYDQASNVVVGHGDAFGRIRP